MITKVNQLKIVDYKGQCTINRKKRRNQKKTKNYVFKQLVLKQKFKRKGINTLRNSHFTIIAVIAYLAIHFIFKFITKIIRRKENNSFLPFGLQLLEGVIFVIIALMIMQRFEATKEIYSSILSNISLLVVVLGFIAQESIKNILSGIMITQFKPFKIGQRVTLKTQNITGTIDSITLRHTVIRKFDNTLAVVPNAVINNEVIENTSYDNNTTIGNWLDVCISYDSDVDEAKRIITECMVAHPFYLKEKEPTVLVRDLTPNGYALRATIWTNSVAENFQACSELRVDIKKEFDENNIKIACAVSDVTLRESK